MSTPIFSKSKDRYNTLSIRNVKLSIRISTKRSNIDRMTIGELKSTKKQLNINLQQLTVKDFSKPILEKINRKQYRITVEIID